LNPPNLLQRILGAMLGVALFIAAFIFASVLLAIAATAALLIWGWLWWRTREIRRAAREDESVVIEGEYRVERETRRIEDD
jgi:HAMP domain-containing protein